MICIIRKTTEKLRVERREDQEKEGEKAHPKNKMEERKRDQPLLRGLSSYNKYLV